MNFSEWIKNDPNHIRHEEMLKHERDYTWTYRTHKDSSLKNYTTVKMYQVPNEDLVSLWWLLNRIITERRIKIE